MKDGKKPKFSFFGGLVIGVLAVIAAVLIAVSLAHRSATGASTKASLATSATTKTAIPQPRWIRGETILFKGDYDIEPGQWEASQFSVRDSMRNAYVVGEFRAFGGAGNDIDALLMDSMSYTNWANGHTASAYYSTQGHQTVGKFKTRALPPGSYAFVFSNRYSAVSRKQVTAGVALVYQTISR